MAWGKALGMSRSFSSREGDHGVGDIDAVNLAEVPAHGTQQTAGSAADFERAALLRGAVGKALQFAVEFADQIAAVAKNSSSS